MKEAKLKKAILDLLKLFGIYAWNNRNVGVYDRRRGKYIPAPCRGVPDIIGVLPGGRMIAIEVKVGRNKPTIWQEMFMSELEARGALVFVARSLDDVINVLEREGYYVRG